MITITLTQIALYSSALMILWLTPGPVWVAVLARSVSGGFKSSVPLVFGVAVGDLLWPLVALLGVSFLVSIYADILIVFRYIASIILIIMGIVLILKSDNFFKEKSNLTRPGIWAGFSAVLANPKASLFYMTLLPNFFNFDKLNSVDIVTICCLSAIVPMLGNLILAIAVDKMRNFLSSPPAIRKTNIFSGIALILVGLIISFL